MDAATDRDVALIKRARTETNGSDADAMLWLAKIAIEAIDDLSSGYLRADRPKRNLEQLRRGALR
jgi:hypothetical protein